MRYRVWHIPQVPGKPFQVEVPNLTDAVVVLDALAEYDLFQLREGIKPDFSNGGGIEVFNDLLPARDEWDTVEDDEIETARELGGAKFPQAEYVREGL